MATRNYIITLDDSELTDELCQTLQRLGARPQEDAEQDAEPVLTEADKRVLTERMRALEAGEEKLLDIKEVFAEIRKKHFGA